MSSSNQVTNHPEAASSDGRERKWSKVCKSGMLMVAEAKSVTNTNEITRSTATRQDIAKAETDMEAGKVEHRQDKEPPIAKLKYVPGPIGSLIDQAGAVGLHLAVNTNNDLEFRREGRGPIPLTGWNKKAWKQEIKKHMNHDLLRELHDAVAPAYDTEGTDIPPRRKDMVGFPETVDRQATLALLKNSIRKSNKTSGKFEMSWTTWTWS